MYTKRDYDRYAAMLKRMGIVDPAMVEKTLDFVYRLSVITAEIISIKEDDGQEEKQEDQSRPDEWRQEGSSDLDEGEHKRAG